MYPHERSLVAELADDPFALIGVNSDDLGVARQAVATNGLTWPSFQDRRGGAARAISDEWGVRAWPTLFVLDAEMAIHYRGHDLEAAAAVARRLVATMASATHGDRGHDVVPPNSR